MKKIFSFFILLSIFFGYFGKTFAFLEEKYFIVTAYYSPLSGQEYYMRGNLEKEKILQGNGVYGASGKKVFSGMLAAPKNYNFGTKIYLEGLGVGVVEDRGQAIVKKGERGYNHDRLDVWMGYGDEGLKRALAWGKRKVKGQILDDSAEVTINYKNHPSPESSIEYLKKQNKTIFDLDIGKNSDREDIKNLQTFLKEHGFYKGEIDGIYNSEIIDLIFDFQIKNNILTSQEDFGAGFWGVKTRKLFKEAIEKNLKKEEKQENLETNKNINIFIEFKNTEENIKKVEKIFKEIGFLSEEKNLDKNNFSENILEFQLEEKIIISKDDLGAGNFGPKTRQKLKEKYEIFIDNKILEENKKLEENLRLQEAKIKSIELTDEKLKKLQNKVLKKGEISEEVRILQEVLAELGYFSEKTTAIFGKKTEDSLKNFQIENNLIKNKKDINAGVFGEKEFFKIRENLQNEYLDKIINNKDNL